LQVVSFGADFQFGKERKPEGAGSRCMKDCPYGENCIFSAKSNYLAYPRWGQYVWKCLESNKNLTEADQEESLKTDNRYGKCVWDFERDGNVDHQAVMFNFANGATGTFITSTGDCPGTNRFEIVCDGGTLVCDKTSLKLYRLNPWEPEYSSTTKKVFGKPEVIEETPVLEGENTQHVGVLNAFRDAILSGGKLVAD